MMTEGVAMYKTLSGKAWRNGMVAVVNAALEQGHIGLEPHLHASSAGGSDRWLKTDDDYIKNKVFAFEVGGIPAVGALRRCTWALNEDELSVHVALWPTEPPKNTSGPRGVWERKERLQSWRVYGRRLSGAGERDGRGDL